MSLVVKNSVKTWQSFQVATQPQIKYEPLKMSEITKNLWEVLAIDLTIIPNEITFTRTY